LIEKERKEERERKSEGDIISRSVEIATDGEDDLASDDRM